MRVLSAPPLVLEPQLAAHAHEMFGVLSDPAIYQFENEPPPSEDWLRDRYARLESRRSPDGTQAWLNWVVRLPCGELAGYVQATVLRDGVALIAYELASRFWRQGVGSRAVAAVLDELELNHGVRLHVAVLKARNARSLGLLRKLGFDPASAEQGARFGGEADEAVWVKPAQSRQGTAGVTVRAATAGDIDALVALMEAFYAESGHALDRRWAAASFAALLARPEWGRAWRADVCGEPAGHAVLTVRYAMEHGALGGHVDDLFVHPAFRRRGVARALLDALFGECRARGCLSVQVEARDDAAALGLYARFGLVPHRDGRLSLAGPVAGAGGPMQETP